jgi:hypothetical protein
MSFEKRTAILSFASGKRLITRVDDKIGFQFAPAPTKLSVLLGGGSKLV